VTTARTVDPAELLEAAAATLHASGAETERTEERAHQLAAALGVRVRTTLGWSQSSLEITDATATRERRFAAMPAAINMRRVVAIDRALDDLSADRSSPAQAAAAIAAARTIRPAPVLLFALACAVGASGLAVILGAEHGTSIAIIAATAAGGAFLRRGIGRLGGSNFSQVFLAAILAGLGGALAAQLDVSSALRLAAVCPCMVLVPGPHLLNGMLDIAAMRLPLGLARLAFATITLIAIGAGLVIGLGLGGADLVVQADARTIPLWLDAPVAGVVAICYGIFYSAPLRILVWPFVVGGVVHGVHWLLTENAHLGVPLSAGLSCLIVGVVLLPIGRRLSIPFSAIGFASVVALIPGVLVFRALAALAQLQGATGATTTDQLVQAILTDTGTAVLTVAAMALGFVIPAAVLGRLVRRPAGAPAR